MQISPRALVLGTLFASFFSASGYLAATRTFSAQAETSIIPNELVAADRFGSREGPTGKAGENRDNPERFFEQLSLNESQLQSIRTIREDARSNLQPLRDQVRISRQEIRELMASNASTSELRQKYETLSSLEQQLRTERFETMLQIREVLTPEQRAELGALMEQRRSEHQPETSINQGPHQRPDPHPTQSSKG